LTVIAEFQIQNRAKIRSSFSKERNSVAQTMEHDNHDFISTISASQSLQTMEQNQ